MEAYEGYWRKMPSVKRLVFKSVPEATTRAGHAEARRGRHRLPARRARRPRSVKRDPTLKLAFSGGIGTVLPRLPRPVGPEVAVARPAGAAGRQLRASTARRSARRRRSAPPGRRAASSRATFEFALPARARIPTIRRRPSSCWPRPGYPNGFDAGELYPWPPYFSMGEAVGNYLGAVGIKMQDAARWSAPPSTRRWPSKKLQGRLRLHQRASTATPPRACRRSSRATGAFAYGGYPDIDALYKQQARETDRKKREAHAAPDPAAAPRAGALRARSMDYIWPSGVGPARGRARADADRPLPVVGARSRTSGSRSRRPAPAPRAGTGWPGSTSSR